MDGNSLMENIHKEDPKLFDILAKEIGEKVCKNLEYKTNMKIIIERLEKIQTDQTLSVMRQPLLDAVSVSINIANLMSFHANE